MGQQKIVGRSPRAKMSSRATDSVMLTRRQQEILKLIADGLTNREISDQLSISPRTVEVHRFNLMRRLRVRNVAQLIRQALQMGFLSAMAQPVATRH
jgi:DNA-binding NarL/FixJ family response regulator